MKKLLSTLPLFLMIMGCNQAPMATDPSVISSKTDAWEAAFNAKDVDGIVAIYTSDGRVLPPNAPMASGGDAIRTIFGGFIDAGIGAELASIETKVSGDVAYDVGTYILRIDGEVIDTGKFIETFVRGTDGEWLMSNDIFNSDNPPAAPAE
jgi:ketosteroid isomerase-like protein